MASKLTKAVKAWCWFESYGVHPRWRAEATITPRRNDKPCYIVPAAEYERLTKRRKARNAK